MYRKSYEITAEKLEINNFFALQAQRIVANVPCLKAALKLLLGLVIKYFFDSI